MSNYRRSTAPGGSYFFTVVTYRRQALLTLPESRQVLREMIHKTRQKHPFTIDAWVLLPDHLHCLWTLPPGDMDYAKRWSLIKSGFTRRLGHLLNKPEWMTPSKIKHRESTLWQRRYWEHQIRDEEDFERHFNYIHWNPVKHGHVTQVADWPYSTFHRYRRMGLYDADWCGEQT